MEGAEGRDTAAHSIDRVAPNVANGKERVERLAPNVANGKEPICFALLFLIIS